MNTKLNSVTASKFLDWYFSDSDDVTSFGDRCVEMIQSEGFVNLSARQLFDECGYIPQFICEDSDGNEEYSPSDIEFINDAN